MYENYKKLGDLKLPRLSEMTQEKLQEFLANFYYFCMQFRNLMNDNNFSSF